MAPLEAFSITMLRRAGKDVGSSLSCSPSDSSPSRVFSGALELLWSRSSSSSMARSVYCSSGSMAFRSAMEKVILIL